MESPRSPFPALPLVRRLGMVLLLATAGSLLSFLVLAFSRSDAAEVFMRDRYGGARPPAEAIAETRRAFGLDLPVPQRLALWVGNAVRGDFGRSFFTARPVVEEVGPRLLRTVLLALASAAVAVFLSLGLALASAVPRSRWPDAGVVGVACLLACTPAYVMGFALVLSAALGAGLLPAAGDATLAHYVLPALTLGLCSAAAPARTLRDALRAEMASDYVRTALAYGATRGRAVRRHALRNALVPWVATMGSVLRNLLAGALVVETLFDVRGLGSYLVQAVEHRDLPAMQFGVLVVAGLSGVATLLTDVALAIVDPRARRAGALA